MMSDEVSQFLKDAKELRERQVEVDKARSKELEEEILQAKRERQARREERARSISPQKSSPANTPPPPLHRQSIHGTDDLKSLSLFTADSFRSETMEATIPFSTSPSKENDSPFDLDADASGLGMTSATGDPLPSRALPWQRRPTLQASEKPRKRPLSVVAAENARHRLKSQPSGTSTSEQASATEPVPPKEQTAQTPPIFNDPSWDMVDSDDISLATTHGRDQPEDENHADTTAANDQLLGMPSPEPLKRDAILSRPDVPARLNSSPNIFANAQRLDAPLEEEISPTNATATAAAAAAPMTAPMSPPSGRTSPNRPISPTKGLGGFVQSAMMKRSDSVKRWSVTSPPGLVRADSTVSNRGSTNRDGAASTSRPTSRHGTEEKAEAEPVAASRTTPAEPRELRLDPSVVEDEDLTSPVVTPSRTMDPRRWSPTKSSWLETALSKPDSTKTKPNLIPSAQPAWMVELNKAKAQKAGNPATTEPSSGVGSASQKHAVNIGGLMRSSPMGAAGKPAVTGGLGGVHSPPVPSTSPLGFVAGNNSLRKSKSKGNLGADAEMEMDTGVTGNPATSPTSDQKIKSEGVNKDFRANLKPRYTPADSRSGGNATPEFKQVFGTLRKTKTQNYVAPDELKSNILRGKAALNMTGGPQKSEKVDDFKDAILRKKSEFQQAQAEGKGIVANTKPNENLVPAEGLTRHATLGRRGSAADIRETRIDPLARSGSTHRRLLSEAPPKFKPSMPEMPMPEMPMPTAAGSASSTTNRGHAPSGSLAGRVNANLASLIARGPPAAETGGSKDKDELKPSDSFDAPPSGPQLTHMTKNRARGPRRKAPPASVTAPIGGTVSTEPRFFNSAHESIGDATKDIVKQDVIEGTSTASSLTTITQSPPRSVSSSAPQSIHAQVAAEAALRKYPPTKVPKHDIDFFTPATTKSTTSSPIDRPPSPVRMAAERLSFAEKQSGSATQQEQVSQTPFLQKLGRRQTSEILDKPSEPLRSPDPTKDGSFPTFDEASKPPSTMRLHSRSRSQSPTKVADPIPGIGPPAKLVSDNKVDSEPVLSMKNPAATSHGSRPPSPRKEENTSPVEARTAPRALPQVPNNRSRSLSRPATSHSMFKSPELGAAASRPGSPTRSPTKQAIEASSLLNEFFGSQRPKRDYRVDAADILMNRPKDTPRIRTRSATLWQMFGGGHKTPVPAHSERELFEEQMYLCAHTFADEAGKETSELYFWVGDQVAQSAVEDAEVFAWREAKAFGGTLVKLRQGKETGEFLQALGGTVITRRGSSNRYDSLAPSMLCGRRFMGQITFDEVNFSTSSLCSGFPFLITHNGRAYLWIGKGSDVDEISCARLIGMDLTLTGELEEVGDGNEPAIFWDIFGDGGPKSSSADHWKLKPSYDKYCARLFFSDSSSSQQVTEISPFSQSDLRPTGIYVLDAFFEMYIVVGRQAQPQYLAFRTALEFAQEYAILASGMEDRPFIPISTVVLEGIPRDLKSVFRNWRDSESPTVTPEVTIPGPGGLKRGRSLRILPLTHALQALKE